MSHSDDREDGPRAELEAALEAFKQETWKAGQTLPKLRRAIALILQDLKRECRRGSKCAHSWP